MPWGSSSIRSSLQFFLAPGESFLRNEPIDAIKKSLYDRFARDPLAFCRFFWPNMVIFDKQAEVLASVQLNKETFVHAANKLGKTYIAAVVVLWFLTTRFPAKIVTSSSSEKQLRKILWSEIHSLIRKANPPLPFVLKDIELGVVDSEGVVYKNHYAIGLVPRQVESFQGHHLDLGDGVDRTLALFDEASGISDEFYEAAQSWASKILVIGNPLSLGNFFFHRCKGGDFKRPTSGPGLLRKVIHISADDSPNVMIGKQMAKHKLPGEAPVIVPGILTYDEYLERRATWDKWRQRVRIDGLFPEDESTQSFPFSWLERASALWELTQQIDYDGPYSMGIDVAAGGRDDTCWMIVGQHGVRRWLVLDLKDTMEIVGQTIQFMQEFSIPGQRVCLDSGGGGKQIADRLREQRYQVRDIHFGSSPWDKVQYFNRRAELYGRLRQVMDPQNWTLPDGMEAEEGTLVGFSIPPDDKLREELGIVPLSFDSEGKFKLPPKDKTGKSSTIQTIKELLQGRSPDRSDALALAVTAAWTAPRMRPPKIDRKIVVD